MIKQALEDFFAGNSGYLRFNHHFTTILLVQLPKILGKFIDQEKVKSKVPSMFSKRNIISHPCRICFTYHFKKMFNSFKLAKNVVKIFYLNFSSTAICSKLFYLACVEHFVGRKKLFHIWKRKNILLTFL